MSEHMKNWMGVPAGSTLVISVTGTTAEKLVTAVVRKRIGGKPAGVSPDNEVQPGPLRVPLPTVDAFGFDVVLTAATAATAKLSAFVELPNRSHFENDDFTESYDLAKDDTTIVELSVLTIDPAFAQPGTL